MKRLLVGLLLSVAVGAGVRAYYANQGGNQPHIVTARVGHGSIVNTVTATGTLESLSCGHA